MNDDAGTTGTTGHVVVERPPTGLARGEHATSAWVIGAVGSTVVILAAAYFIWRVRRTKRS